MGRARRREPGFQWVDRLWACLHSQLCSVDDTRIRLNVARITGGCRLCPWCSVHWALEAFRAGGCMESMWIVISALMFLAAGLGIGLLLARHGRSAAAVEARQAATVEIAALQQDVKNWEARAREVGAVVAQHEERVAKDQDRFVAVSSELARAKAIAEQVAPVTAALDERERSLEAVRAELQAANVATAQAQADLASSGRCGEESAAEVARLRGAVEALQKEVTGLVEEKTRLASELDAERKAAADRAAEAERAKEQVRAEIEILAARLLDEKGKAMLDRSREGLEALLKPVADKLRDFEAKVEKTYDQENRDRASLLASLRQLQDTQAKLHQDAESLARALTGDSKAQGDWGEVILERVLETAGLTEGREYDLQVSHVDEEGGRKRPDALVYLPGNRVVIVDAKCSLTAFVEGMRAQTDEARAAALHGHVASVRAHVRELALKSYQDIVKERTVDIVLLFIPNEAAFHAAIARDVGLYDEAFRQRVVLCSPTTLFAALQLISHVWRSEKQNTNAQKIAEEAGKLLEKLNAFLVDLNQVGARLDQAQASFGAAKNKLISGKGNVVKKAADLVKLGARVRPEKIDALALEASEAEDAIEVLAITASSPDCAPVA